MNDNCGYKDTINDITYCLKGDFDCKNSDGKVRYEEIYGTLNLRYYNLIKDEYVPLCRMR